MKNVSFIIPAIIVTLLSLLSCANDPFEGVDLPVLIDGRTLPGEYTILDHGIDKTSGSIWYTVFPVRYEDPHFKNGNLYYAVLNGHLFGRETQEESFAFEHILNRTAPVAEEMVRYRRELLNSGQLLSELRTRDTTEVAVRFANTYVTGSPTVVADDILFGQEPGTDLSEWFRVKDWNILGIIGRDYTIERRADLSNKYVDFSEYFVKDRMMPIGFSIASKSIPEEISTDDFGVLHWDSHTYGNTIIKVTVTIPVLFEYYWDWCEALSSNPDAQEVFHEGSLTFIIPLVKKK